MRLAINAEVQSSFKVKLTYDDAAPKTVILSIGDLIDCEYNSNGLRKHITGRIIKISAAGTDPNGWWLMVDGSGDFDTNQARFTVMNIIDVDIIQKYDTQHNISTPNDRSGILSLKVVDGRLLYTKDGYHWEYIKTQWYRDGIKPEEGTVPVSMDDHGTIPYPDPQLPPPPPPQPRPIVYPTDDDTISDEVY